MHLNLHTTINTTEKIDPKLPASEFISDKLKVFFLFCLFSQVTVFYSDDYLGNQRICIEFGNLSVVR